MDMAKLLKHCKLRKLKDGARDLKTTRPGLVVQRFQSHGCFMMNMTVNNLIKAANKGV
jgi:hypothetical protein